MKKRVVCIGGGNGTAQILKGLKDYPVEITGIIGVTDSGRSTGKARILANIPAPGDIRNALVSLSTQDKLIQDLFQFRFQSKKLADFDGMAFGNLFIAALSQMTGSFENAISQTAKFLNIKGSIIPIMLQSTHIACERTDGTFDYEDVNVRQIGKPPIKRLFLKDSNVSLHSLAKRAIKQADLITIGPGSLYTTVIACLLTPGLKEILASTHANVVFVMNTTTQPGQTDAYTIADHFNALSFYLKKGTIDLCLVNKRKPNPQQRKKLKNALIAYLPFTQSDKRILSSKVEVLQRDLIEDSEGERSLWNKQDTVCHDPKKIARALIELLTP